jgi:hypothetical protein
LGIIKPLYKNVFNCNITENTKQIYGDIRKLDGGVLEWIMVHHLIMAICGSDNEALAAIMI